MQHFDSDLRQQGRAALKGVFGAAWTKLDESLRKLVLQDFLEAQAEDGINAENYRSRIGAANLKSYADVMVVRERKGWDKR